MPLFDDLHVKHSMGKRQLKLKCEKYSERRVLKGRKGRPYKHKRPVILTEALYATGVIHINLAQLK